MNNLDKLNEYILEKAQSGSLDEEIAIHILKSVNGEPAYRDRDNTAIIGMACRLPDAANKDEYWENIKSGRSSIKEFPEQRKNDIDRHLSLNQPGDRSLAHYLKAGYLEEIDKFDAAFFRLSPIEALMIEPMQRIMLETVWETLEDAGYGGNSIYGTNTGVFIGRDHTSAGATYKSLITEPDPLVMTGSYAGILASRIAYVLDLQGPAMVMDTACSSGLVAVHEACMKLKSGECDTAIAGGIQIMYIPMKENLGTLVESADSLVRAFDRDANGTVWSEGVGAVLLKPLDKALADKDHIYAVIKGSAINNDGASNGITAPSATAQEKVIASAWDNAGIDPETIAYIEAHGTGTRLGDPVEIKGLTNAFRRYTQKKQFCSIGSVKGNIGHPIASSGIAALIKVVLSIRNKQIPPSINFNVCSPYINFCSSPIYLNDTLSGWEKSEFPRRAGVSSFGFSGTNCHMVLEEAPETAGTKQSHIPYILAISARTRQSLLVYVERYAEFVNSLEDVDLQSICYTANTGKGHYKYRLAITFKSFDELVSVLNLIRKKTVDSIAGGNVYYGEHTIVTKDKAVRNKYDITVEEKQKLSRQVASRLQQIISGRDSNSHAAADICSLYVAGAEIEWEEFYKETEAGRTELPVYPFEKMRYWPEAEDSGTPIKGADDSTVQSLIAESMYEDIYSSSFDTRNFWFIKEHRVFGNYVVPGTLFLELAGRVSGNYIGQKGFELKDTVIMNPLMLEDGQAKEVHTIIKKDQYPFAFTIASSLADRVTGRKTWIEHAAGSFTELENTDRPSLDLENIKSRLELRNELIPDIPKEVFDYGPRWDNYKELYAGQDEILLMLRQPPNLPEDMGKFRLHPALLDNALNIAGNVFSDGVYLPLSYKSIKVYCSLPPAFYSYVRTAWAKKSEELRTFDISLADEKGLLLAEIKEYSIKRVRDVNAAGEKYSSGSICHTLSWIRQEEHKNEHSLNNRTILAFKGKTGLSQKIIDKMKLDKNRVIEVETGIEYAKSGGDNFIIPSNEEGYARLLSELKPEGISMIVHMQSLRGDAPVETLSELTDTQNTGVDSMFYLVKALIGQKIKSSIDVIVLSDYVNKVTGDDVRINAHNAPVIALAKTAAQEYSNLNVRCMDIDAETGPEIVYNELGRRGSIFLTAFRNGIGYIENFEEVEIEPSRNENFKSRGVYVITGGTGGIGLLVAKYLSAKKKLNIALLGRSRITGRPQPENGYGHKLEAIREIESSGSVVELCSLDICDPGELERVLDSLREKFGGINGVIHCAGVPGEGFLFKKEKKAFDAVMASKVKGTWLIAQQTRKDNLDFFVMFSSVASILGSAGQGDYAAANAFMDSFSYQLRNTGINAVAISWTLWKGIGMAEAYSLKEEQMVFEAIGPGEAMDIFGRVLASGLTRVICGRVNKRLAGKTDTKAHTPEAKNNNERAAVKIKGKQESEYSSTEIKLANIWAEVLNLREIDIYESFYNMGGDSILAARLQKRLERDYPGLLDITDIFAYSHVSRMAEYIAEKTGKKSGAAANDIDYVLGMLANGGISAEQADELMKSKG